MHQALRLILFATFAFWGIWIIQVFCNFFGVDSIKPSNSLELCAAIARELWYLLGYSVLKLWDLMYILDQLKNITIDVLIYLHDHLLWWLPLEILEKSFMDIWNPSVKIILSVSQVGRGILEAATTFNFDIWIHGSLLLFYLILLKWNFHGYLKLKITNWLHV